MCVGTGYRQLMLLWGDHEELSLFVCSSFYLSAVFCPVITAANEVSHEATQAAKTVIDEIGSDIQFFFNVRKKWKICACLWVWSTLKQMRKRHNCWAILISENQNLTLIHTHLLQHTRTDLDLYICCFFHQSHSQPYCLFPLSNSWSQSDLSVSVMTLFTVSQTFPITLLCQVAWFPSKFQISLIYIKKTFGGGGCSVFIP